MAPPDPIDFFTLLGGKEESAAMTIAGPAKETVSQLVQLVK